MHSLIKQCIAEVIVEPHPRKKKVYGNPRRLQASYLIKECIMEVLKENLLAEAFDPTSQGPNMVQDNPYPEMNAKMRMMEEPAKMPEADKKKKVARILKKAQGWVDTKKSQGWTQQDFAKGLKKFLKVKESVGGAAPKEDAWKRYERGYGHGEAHKRSGQKPKETMDNVESVGYHDAIMGKPKSTPDVVRKGIKETDPHGRYAQQAGATPFQSPGDTSIVEDQDPEAVITKVRKEVYAALAKEGFQPHGEEPRDYVEYYLNGFMTVQVSVGYDSKAARVERYYDSEMVNNMPGHNVVRSFPVPVPYSATFVQKFIKYAIALKRSGQGDESIFGGIDDIEESQRTQSTEVEWPCPHCGQPTVIPVEIESPSDYIACADCEQCGKEISDPRLDQKVYATVIDYYSGKADYLKDTH